MEKYIGVKLIEAEPMNLGNYNKFKGWTIPKDEDPQREGYIIIYSDDYISWSPKEVFEEAYRLTAGMTFGLALEAVKKDFKIARNGWNGKNMHVETVSFTSSKGYKIDNLGLVIKTPDNKYNNWIPSITDLLAEDWRIVE